MSPSRYNMLTRMAVGVTFLMFGGTLLVTRWGFSSPVGSSTATSARDSRVSSAEQRLIFAAGVVEGTSEPLEIRFEVPGRIRSVFVTDGQQIHKNEVIAELDPAGYELGVRMAEATLRGAQLQSQLFESVAENSVPGGKVLNSGDANGSTRTVSANRAAVANDQLIANSRVEQAAVALEKEQWQLEKTRLQSPINGTVIECKVQPGELVGPQGNSGTFRLVDRSKTRVRAWIEELDAMDVRPGLSAVVVASGSVERRYRGSVISCASFVQPKSERHMNPGERVDVRVREIVVELKEGDDLLLGLPVEVFIAPRRESRN